MVLAWILEEIENQHSPNKKSPNVEVSEEELLKLGVFFDKLNPDEYAEGERYLEDSKLKRYTTEQEYASHDILEITKEKLFNYDKKLKCFYTEHFHKDDEIRYVVEGSGYFDFRNEKDEWVRVFIEKGDLIGIPAGIYHRFTLDESDYIKEVRLFVGDPIWLAVNRPADDHFTRKKYVKKYYLGQ